MADDKESPQGPFADWMRVQMNFQARLMDETFRYLRQLQGVAAPVTPGTVLLPERGTELKATTEPGADFEVALEVRNQQRVHAVAAPTLDPLVSSSGTTWYPEASFTPGFALLAPDESLTVVVRVSVPSLVPADTYVGALSLRGFRQTAFRLIVEVKSATAPARSRRRPRKPQSRRTRKP
jgi:hypothetical protein